MFDFLMFSFCVFQSEHSSGLQTPCMAQEREMEIVRTWYIVTEHVVVRFVRKLIWMVEREKQRERVSERETPTRAGKKEGIVDRCPLYPGTDISKSVWLNQFTDIKAKAIPPVFVSSLDVGKTKNSLL